mmetsp:Transcript_88113/g.273011  ORF Transcript_88113/g.273011 Transcript_88113/m.273011 type:complete len:206 (+) Transcript_88113:189-806(+)
MRAPLRARASASRWRGPLPAWEEPRNGPSTTAPAWTQTTSRLSLTSSSGRAASGPSSTRWRWTPSWRATASAASSRRASPGGSPSSLSASLTAQGTPTSSTSLVPSTPCAQRRSQWGPRRFSIARAWTSSASWSTPTRTRGPTGTGAAPGSRRATAAARRTTCAAHTWTRSSTRRARRASSPTPQPPRTWGAPGARSPTRVRPQT